ncbi:uncharacterized protein LOC110453459 [Mizuhopecten yessoensis]|uniref:uncharacterized protein LOC110453459 n=1 Tax=Mizuhopecten yessoensis TaxID=6573 RepID=UPI000B45E8B6|nr:uncharacterized protein LOC110453459 [Mizuhopecten yessoensis]
MKANYSSSYNRDKVRPALQCPPDQQKLSDDLQDHATVTWNEPKAIDDRDGEITPTRQGLGPGYIFSEGITVIGYYARDNSGNMARCTFKINITVPRCRNLGALKDGYSICHTSFDMRKGTVCQFGCYDGHTLVGSSSTMCTQHGTWTTGLPKCDRTTCDPPLTATGEASVQCSDNNFYRSKCSYICAEGFDVTPGMTRVRVCTVHGTWRGKEPKCTDITRPLIRNCTGAVYGFAERGSTTGCLHWTEPSVFDNADKSIRLSRTGPSSDARLTAGTYDVKYNAEDESGNKAIQCTMKIIVKAVQLCEDNVLPPDYGAIACDYWLGGKFCQMLCKKGYDIPPGYTFPEMIVCSETGQWLPTSTLPDCAKTFSSQASSLAMDVHYYFEGDCSDANVLTSIKEKFIQALMTSTFRDACEVYTEKCYPGNVQVQCGSLSGKRSLSLNVKFDMKIVGKSSFGNMSFGRLNENIMKAINKHMNNDTFELLDLPNNETMKVQDFSHDSLRIVCNERMIPSYSSESCIECPPGTFYDRDTQSCPMCPVGEFQPSAASSACIHCPTEQTTRQQGATSINECEDACSPGTFSYNGLPPCTPCPVGMYVDTYGTATCRVCPASSTTIAEGTHLKSDCKDGDFIGSISHLNVWSKGMKLENILEINSRCDIVYHGDLLAWKEFESVDGDDVFVQIPSECDDQNDCDVNSCNGGICKDELHAYSCVCPVGLSGDKCEINIDDCVDNACENNSTCVDGIGEYTCQCGIHFKGDLCEIAMVDGDWSVWSNWSVCSASCGNGTTVRKRLCNNPTPDHGGKDCVGENTDIMICNVENFCTNLTTPSNSILFCNWETAMDAVYCTLTCEDGYDFDHAAKEDYHCGPDTFHLWDFQTDDNPYGRLPACTKKTDGRRIEWKYMASYEQLICDNKDTSELIAKKIKTAVYEGTDTLTCQQDGSCSLLNIEVRDCQVDRFKRSTNPLTAGFAADFTCDAVKLPCSAGRYQRLGKCDKCDVGTYQQSTGQTSCVSCPVELTTEGRASTSVADCKVHVDTSANNISVWTHALPIIIGVTFGICCVVTSLLIRRKCRTVKKERKIRDMFAQYGEHKHCVTKPKLTYLQHSK